MTRTGNILLVVAACIAGLATGELLYRSPICREVIARFCGHGELLAIVHGVGIYEADQAAQAGHDLEALILAENLRHASRGESISQAEIDRELNLIIAQFADEKSFVNALQSLMLSKALLAKHLGEHLRERTWIEKQIALQLSATDEERRKFFDTRSEHFTLPQRFRASHVFLATHDGTPAEDAEGKRKAIQTLATRISKGETLANVAVEISEDEATKLHGGDLGFFSATRMPPEFMAQVEKLRIGQITTPFQSHLGFHIVELTDSKPARGMSFEEARGEIAVALANERRAVAVARLSEQLTGTEFRRPAR